jgi:ferritin-like metal-binding protein YciE
MGLLSKPIGSLDELFVHTLQDVYYAEQQIIKALPTMIDKASDPQLKQGFQSHLAETKNQVKRLEQVFKMHGAEVKAVKCPAIDGIIDEAQEILGDAKDSEVRDAAALAGAQAVEHYEIARYGTLIAWAEAIGHDEIVRLLTTNLNEEKAADKKLSTVALRKGVNRKAASG